LDLVPVLPAEGVESKSASFWSGALS
jgi:hypothetical protein